jgi:hypothetical protein
MVSGFVNVATVAGDERPMSFLTADGPRLMDGDDEFRFISFNIPNLHNVEDAFTFTGQSPWRWPNEFEIEDALESVRQAGGTVVRTYVLSVGRDGGDAGRHVHVLGPGQFNEEAFRALDKVLEVAARKRIRVLVPLVDNWHWWGGAQQYAGFRDKPTEAFWTDPAVIADFKRTVEFVVNRRNTFTGIRYRDDPALFGWETGNEIDAPPEWTRQIAAYLKQLDTNHLVVDGNSLHGILQSSLDDPNVDVVCTHHYPDRRVSMVDTVREAIRDIDRRKPYFVGEFGFVPLETVEELLDTVIDDGASGALLWSLRFHRREGGFYRHSEPAGGGIYKAYHWPGFASGERYEERAVLELMRNKAYAIRGEPVPDIAPPRPPHLLPILDPAHISWQGSAGATNYDLQRADAPDGPWATVVADVSDAANHLPWLVNDATIELCQPYYYRVLAKNGAGSSQPSNVIGPVCTCRHTLVDELANLDHLAAHSGDLRLVTDGARRTQEDANRLQVLPGASITYQTAGPMLAWSVWTFADPSAGELRVLGSSDGQSFSPIAAQREVTHYEGNDYGYLRPVRYHGEALDESVRWLRIESPAAQQTEQASSVGVEVSRVEVRFGP